MSSKTRSAKTLHMANWISTWALAMQNCTIVTGNALFGHGTPTMSVAHGQSMCVPLDGHEVMLTDTVGEAGNYTQARALLKVGRRGGECPANGGDPAYLFISAYTEGTKRLGRGVYSDTLPGLIALLSEADIKALGPAKVARLMETFTTKAA